MITTLIVLCTALSPVLGTGPIYGPIMCGTYECELPDCWCISVATPGSIWDEETPQLVVLAVEGSVDDVGVDAVQAVIQGLNNPDGCPVSGTWFVYDQKTDYQLVNTLYNHNIEIGVMPMLKNDAEFWENALYGDWLLAIEGAKAAVGYLGNVPVSEIRGVRAHDRRMGGNHQIQPYLDYRSSRPGDFVYDSSWQATAANLKNWPFTLDFDNLEPCLRGHCPFDSFPGIWEYQMIPYLTEDDVPCYTLTECELVKGKESHKDFLKRNFLENYTKNRTPFTINLDPRFFNNTDIDYRILEIREFLNDILTNNPDTYVLSMKEALEWIRHPANKSDLQNFPHWSCGKVDRPTVCEEPVCCAYDLESGCLNGKCGETEGTDIETLHKFCVECPAVLPVLGNPYGLPNNVDACQHSK